MAQKEMAIIISVCKHCFQNMEVIFDLSDDQGRWEAPRIGGLINGDVITNVRPIAMLHSNLPCYEVVLDTRIKPHCEAARKQK